MKTLFIFLLVFMSVYMLNSQNKIEANLLLSTDSIPRKEVKIISCQSSIYNDSPLFIIDGVPFTSNYKSNSSKEKVDFSKYLSSDDIVSIEVLKGVGATALYGSSGKNGVVIIYTKKHQQKIPSRKDVAFKLYEFRNQNWINTQDIFNAIVAKVPSVRISNSTLNNQPPLIHMRGDVNTIVIVDGIRYDASILNTLNPADIESVKVSNSPLAQNYFINN